MDGRLNSSTTCVVRSWQSEHDESRARSFTIWLQIKGDRSRIITAPNLLGFKCPEFESRDPQLTRCDALIWLRRNLMVAEPAAASKYGYDVRQIDRQCIWCVGRDRTFNVYRRQTTCLLAYERWLERRDTSQLKDIMRTISNYQQRAVKCPYSPPDSSCFDEIPSPQDTLRFGVIER